MALEAISFIEGDLIIDQSDQEIVKIVEIRYNDYTNRPQDYLLEVIKTGTGWVNIKPGEKFWADAKDLHWVYKKLDKSHPAYILYGNNYE